MFDQNSILNDLDHAFQKIEMPCFGNMNIDYISSCLSAYRSQEQWLLLFNSITWIPAAEGLMTLVEMVGPGVIGQQGFDQNRVFVPGSISLDEDERIVSIRVRGADVDPNCLSLQRNNDLHPDCGFWASVALAATHRESLLALRTEVEPFIPLDFRHVITIEAWDHPTWETPPSQTVAFPRLADILVTSDASRWQPVDTPNTHWSHWLPK